MKDTLSRPSVRSRWTLDPDVVFLNHGSFGATPRAVLEVQSELRARMEREPVLFLAREVHERIDAAKARLAEFLRARPEDLAPVPNATTGVNAVLRSLTLAPGDELLTTSQGYNACANTLRFVAERSGAQVVVADVPFPLRSADEVVAAVMARVNGRTRLALLDHVTSPTALVYPIERLARDLKARGVRVLVDGAHAPGMLALDLEALGEAGVDYYTGNCHKWMCAPKGAAFLWVRRALQREIRPVVISHGANANDSTRSRFRLEFDWVGTDDPTAFLSVPAAIDHLAEIGGGWEAVRAHNHALALDGRQRILEALGVDAPVPETSIGSIASIPLPPGRVPERMDAFTVEPLQAELFREERIEVPIFWWPAPPQRLVRISAQLYNTPDEYAQLARALAARLSTPARR